MGDRARAARHLRAALADGGEDPRVRELLVQIADAGGTHGSVAR
jgi:hypothetical protein